MIALAVIPSIILFILVWRNDKIEKEPASLLLKLFLFGALTIISAGLIGQTGTYLLQMVLPATSLLYIFIDNFFLTALVEEGGKYFVLKKATWKHPAFNFTFDAVVYSVCVSLGFATLENIIYLIDGDVGTAISRGILSVPGHVSYAIFMGYYYGMAKFASIHGYETARRSYLKKALWIPVILHGFYDFCLSTEYVILTMFIIVFSIVLTVIAIKKVKKLSGSDTYLDASNLPETRDM